MISFSLHLCPAQFPLASEDLHLCDWHGNQPERCSVQKSNVKPVLSLNRLNFQTGSKVKYTNLSNRGVLALLAVTAGRVSCSSLRCPALAKGSSQSECLCQPDPAGSPRPVLLWKWENKAKFVLGIDPGVTREGTKMKGPWIAHPLLCKVSDGEKLTTFQHSFLKLTFLKQQEEKRSNKN